VNSLVVTGYGCVTSLGRGPKGLYDGWREGRRGIATIRKFDTTGMECRIGGEMPGRESGPRYLELCGLPEGLNPDLIVATTKGFLGSGAEVESNSVTLDAGLPARWLKERIKARSATTVSTACASGTAALALAWSRRETSDVIVVAGIDLLSDFVFRGFAALRAMDAKPCRPFDSTRAGMTAAEAAAVMVLESEASAKRRGAKILGRLLGGGLGCDATHPTAPDREGRGMATAIAGALSTSHSTFEDLGHVHAHGTGTVFNDAMELKALGDAGRRTPLTTVKGNVGHAFGASGLVEAIASLEAVRHGFLPPVAGLTSPLDGWPALVEGRPLENPRFLKISAGFGGFNAAVVMEGVRE